MLHQKNIALLLWSLTVSTGFMLQTTTAYGSAILQVAIRERDQQRVRSLLAAGANPNQGHALFSKGLLTAAMASARALLAAGAHPNQVLALFRKTPLFTATNIKERAIVQALLAAGADPNHHNDFWIPLRCAIQKGYEGIIQDLLVAGADPDHLGKLDDYTCLIEAANHGEIKQVRMLLAAGANPSFICKANGITPLYAAIQSGHMEVAQLLLAAGASIDSKTMELCSYPDFPNSTEDIASYAESLRRRIFLAGHKEVIFKRAKALRTYLDTHADGNFPTDLQGLVEEFADAPITKKSEQKMRDLLCKSFPNFAQDSTCTIL